MAADRHEGFTEFIAACCASLSGTAYLSERIVFNLVGVDGHGVGQLTSLPAGSAVVLGRSGDAGDRSGDRVMAVG